MKTVALKGQSFPYPSVEPVFTDYTLDHLIWNLTWKSSLRVNDDSEFWDMEVNLAHGGITLIILYQICEAATHGHIRGKKERSRSQRQARSPRTGATEISALQATVKVLSH